MSVSRVRIQTDRDGDPVAVDVVLPSGVPVGELLVAIVDMVDGRASSTGTARHWLLQRAAGGRLDPSSSLYDNDIRDGDLLVLDTEGTPPLGPVRRTACQEVVAARTSQRYLGDLPSGAPGVLATTLASVVLASTAGSDAAMASAVVAAVGAAAAAVATVAAGYPTSACVGVVALTGATGYLAVPSGPAAPNVFLAATAALCTALLMLRLSGHTSPALVAIAAAALPTAGVTLAALPPAVVGAALSTAALALLALAPRLSVLAAGLRPELGTDDAADSAHAILSGLVAGAAVGVASGALVLAVFDQPGAATAALAGVLGTVLLLRVRTYADADRRIALLTGGLVTLTAFLYLVLTSYRGSAGPAAGVLVVVGLVALRRPTCTAVVARMLDRLEYLALAAVVPVACWTGGAYAALGGFGLR